MQGRLGLGLPHLWSGIGVVGSVTSAMALPHSLHHGDYGVLAGTDER
jgi:hypothetical protein